jgi:hypothetical protein
VHLALPSPKSSNSQQASGGGGGAGGRRRLMQGAYIKGIWIQRRTCRWQHRICSHSQGLPAWLQSYDAECDVMAMPNCQILLWIVTLHQR